MKPIRFRDEATAEFREAIDWYEDQEPGLGVDLIDEVHATIQRVAERPAFFPVTFRAVRRALVHRFPHAIYFEESVEEILILAVCKLHGDPSELMDR